MAKDIIKQARIVEIKDNILVLEMCMEDACSGCAAKSLCGSDAEKSKTGIIELQSDGVERIVGDIVSLSISSSMGLKGAFFAYFLPVCLVIAFIIVAQNKFDSDFITGISSLVLLGLYFLILWIFRGKLEKNITITIQ